MRHLNPCFLLVLVSVALGGCALDSASNGIGDASETGVSTGATPVPSGRIVVKPAIASLPDRGDLLRYDQVQRIRTEGASKSYPVTLSEAHAYAALAGGDLVFSMPQGDRLRLRPVRHDEHSDGNWTLVAGDHAGNRALLTFGQDAVFGSITRADGSELRITTLARQVYLEEVDFRRLAYVDGRAPGNGSDILVPPVRARASLVSVPVAAAGRAQPAATASADVGITAANDIDLLIGYTNGIVSRVGSESAAKTLMQSLVSIANEAYANSGVTMRLRLVQSMLVNYTDNNKNTDTLEKLTGSNGSASIPVDPAFNALRAAREAHGADLVSLVRQFRDPEQDGCGVAWILGGGQSAITQADAAFAYSVVSDGSDDGFGCRWETLAHELGHNMGQAHNIEDSLGDNGATLYGAHPYSFGYRETSPNGFYTVMSYRLQDSNQTPIRYFANPAVTYNGRPTGVANQSDNARSLNQTMPIVAAFRFSMDRPVARDVDGDGRSDVLWRNQPAQQFSHWLMSGPLIGGTTGLVMDGNYSVAGVGDFNGDGRADILWSHNSARFLVIWQSQGTTGYTQLEVGGYAAGNEVSGIGDFNADGRADVLWRNRGAGTMYYWAMNGRVSSQSPSYGMPAWFDILGVGDFNSDRFADVLYASTGDVNVYLNTGSGFNGAFRAYRPSGWRLLGLADSNADGITDVYWRNISNGTLTYWAFGPSGIVSTHTYSPSTVWVDGYLGDYNGDGRADILWDRAEWRQLSMWLSTPSGSFAGHVVGNYPLNWSVVK